MRTSTGMDDADRVVFRPLEVTGVAAMLDIRRDISAAVAR